jgi:hypothetical protein
VSVPRGLSGHGIAIHVNRYHSFIRQSTLCLDSITPRRHGAHFDFQCSLPHQEHYLTPRNRGWSSIERNKAHELVNHRDWIQPREGTLGLRGCACGGGGGANGTRTATLTCQGRRKKAGHGKHLDCSLRWARQRSARRPRHRSPGFVLDCINPPQLFASHTTHRFFLGNTPYAICTYFAGFRFQ